jgi:hypothetical protein
MQNTSPNPSTSTSYDKAGVRIWIMDKDGDGMPDIKSMKSADRLSLSFYHFMKPKNEPNQALQTMTTAVTDRAPSSTLRASPSRV